MSNIIFKGKLKKWNEDKGFGFICPENKTRDIFIHISALKNMSRRPIEGDIISYQIHTDNAGKSRAVNATIEGVPTVQPRVRRESVKAPNTKSFFKLLLVAVLIFIGFVVYKTFIKDKDLKAITNLPIISTPKQNENKVNFSCNGKIYCSEMTSCEEATYYQSNCPGTKMDGDGDGVPCESQWCSNW